MHYALTSIVYGGVAPLATPIGTFMRVYLPVPRLPPARHNRVDFIRWVLTHASSLSTRFGPTSTLWVGARGRGSG